jgi:hypothetical protein
VANEAKRDIRAHEEIVEFEPTAGGYPSYEPAHGARDGKGF